MHPKNNDLKRAIELGNYAEAQEIVQEIGSRADAETYYLASKLTSNKAEVRFLLEKAILLDPYHSQAKATLRRIWGKH